MVRMVRVKRLVLRVRVRVRLVRVKRLGLSG